MRVFITALILLLMLSVFIGIHTYTMKVLSDDITAECVEINELVKYEKWEEIGTRLEKIDRIWNKKRMWTALTISTKEIEQIEISLRQSMAFAKIKQKPDFLGEFIMFSMRIDHIPHQEGFYIEDLL